MQRLGEMRTGGAGMVGELLVAPRGSGSGHQGHWAGEAAGAVHMGFAATPSRWVSGPKALCSPAHDQDKG